MLTHRFCTPTTWRVVRGDGVFETLLVRDGRARVVEGHLSRLVLSARALGLPAPVLDDWRLAIEMAAEEWGTEKEGRPSSRSDPRP